MGRKDSVLAVWSGVPQAARRTSSASEIRSLLSKIA